MCMQSVLITYGRDRVPPEQWNPVNWQGYKDLLRQTEALDEALGEPECRDDAKAEWMRSIEERLEKLEGSQ